MHGGFGKHKLFIFGKETFTIEHIHRHRCTLYSLIFKAMCNYDFTDICGLQNFSRQ